MSESLNDLVEAYNRASFDDYIRFILNDEYLINNVPLAIRQMNLDLVYPVRRHENTDWNALTISLMVYNG